MSEIYYTVEKISELLSIHPKTIQRYIREGKLGANKIGKSWRVTGHDLSVFLEQNRPNEEKREPSETRVEVSAVVDMECTEDEATRISNLLNGALHSKPPEYGRCSMHAQYIPDQNKLRISLWGGIEFTEAVIASIAELTRNPE
ncbi:MAG TPA: helix-turn-helix domain-containing protein [Oscillospiraceae bacterium]|nr:helix-turn-helix domain-containing protein [Oscillospiraceae bacterium]HPF55766.1 helix-turn-helix domain-containing protein [Clostridiales bacterium]HPK35095.1 helix-turn-helix domain-containing protein [Oscillospiraceae bacterium]HPR75246.1 helix-turn-helix domain-containing protein [Oscillospiraceae bacterium]